jgi:hypothetical protein
MIENEVLVTMLSNKRTRLSPHPRPLGLSILKRRQALEEGGSTNGQNAPS